MIPVSVSFANNLPHKSNQLVEWVKMSADAAIAGTSSDEIIECVAFYYEEVLLVAMDVTSLYTNIPIDEGISFIIESYTEFYNNYTRIRNSWLSAHELYNFNHFLSLILKKIRKNNCLYDVRVK